MKKTTILPALLAGFMLSSTSATAQDERKGEAPNPEKLAEQYVAEHREAQAAEKEYLQALSAAVREEQRNEKWASEQEKRLRKGAENVDPSLKQALKSVDCRSTKCMLQFELEPASTAETLSRQLSGIDQWVAWSQPCEYTVVRDPKAGTVRAFTDCSK